MLIFLDIDGVLNDHAHFGNGYCGIKAECAENLNRILRTTNAQIVISSAWRYMIPEAMNLLGFEYLLLTHGVDCKSRIIGRTCNDEYIESRSDQIRQWRNEHGGRLPYVVLDDLDIVGHPFVQTDGTVGLTAADADQAIKLLRAQ